MFCYELLGRRVHGSAKHFKGGGTALFLYCFENLLKSFLKNFLGIVILYNSSHPHLYERS